MPRPQKLLDTHIHLWPATALTPHDHTWMKPGHPLVKRYGTREYLAATGGPTGFVYVETDRYLPSEWPAAAAVAAATAGNNDVDVDDDAPTPAPATAAQEAALREWARAPLEELAYLRRVVTGAVAEGDGAGRDDGALCKGLVVWMPFHLGRAAFGAYVKLATEALGGEAAGRVVGCRYLLQGRSAREVERLVSREEYARNVREACREGGLLGGKRRLVFDVGVDAHRDGVEVLEKVEGLVREVGEGVGFVLDHLCKPDLSTSAWPFFPTWSDAMARLSTHPNVSIKLSGALNEFEPTPTPSSTADIVKALSPYLDTILASFGTKRIMFGSDWPVCNVGGPSGEAGNWELWREVVELWMEGKGLSDGEKEEVWWKAGAEAYGIDDI